MSVDELRKLLLDLPLRLAERITNFSEDNAGHP